MTWRDCDFTFRDGVLEQIAPRGGRTIDGVAPGDPVNKAIEMYGKPVETTDDHDGNAMLVFVGDEATGSAFRDGRRSGRWACVGTRFEWRRHHEEPDRVDGRGGWLDRTVDHPHGVDRVLRRGGLTP